MRKRTVRKHWALVNPIKHAIEGASIVSGSKLDKLRIVELSALEAFRMGKATLNDWHALTSMLNLAENMARNGIGVEVLEVAAKAQTELEAAARRYQATKRMGLTGPGLQALRELYEYHDLQRTSITLSEYEAQIRNTLSRVRSKAPEVVEL